MTACETGKNYEREIQGYVWVCYKNHVTACEGGKGCERALKIHG